MGKIADGITQLEVQEFYNTFGDRATQEDKLKLIQRLSAKDMKDQICFKTVRAVKYLESRQLGGKLSKKEIWR